MFMKRYGILVACLTCGLMVGCEQDLHKSSGGRSLDAELVNTLNNVGVENAIITQHTLYPYHFEPDGAELNGLGGRDLSVLARHFAEKSGTLNVRRGDTPVELYEARVTGVLEKLKAAGVDTSRLSISDSMPGGTGMPSERVVTILEKAATGSGMQTQASSGTRITR
jgi:hypothetical protein